MFGVCGMVTKVAVLWVLIQSIGDVCCCGVQFGTKVRSNLLILGVI